MTKQTASDSPKSRGGSPTVTKDSLAGSVLDAPAPQTVMAANGAFPKEGLGADTDDVALRTRVFAHVRAFSNASWGRALWELTHTFAFYYLAFTHTHSWVAFIAAALLRVRLFIIFHDCAHDSFFPSKAVNWYAGLFLGVFNHTPLSFWQRGHNHHHRHRLGENGQCVRCPCVFLGHYRLLIFDERWLRVSPSL